MAFMKIRKNYYVDMTLTQEIGWKRLNPADDEDTTCEVYAVKFNGGYISLDTCVDESIAQDLLDRIITQLNGGN